LKYALFVGCLASVREISYEKASRKVLGELGIEPVTVEDFSCCSPVCLVHGMDYTTGLALTARNICLAEERKLKMLTLCASCFETLSKTNSVLKKDPKLRGEVNDILAVANREFKGTTEVTHVVKALYEDVGLEKLKAAVKRPLNNLRVATFYGCHLVRPHDFVEFDDPESPTVLDNLVETLGAKSEYYDQKKGCCIGCGAFFGGVSEEIALELNHRLMQSLGNAKVDCLVTTCPFCFFRFDMGQLQIADKWGERYGIPVLFYVQLLGLAMKLNPQDLGLSLHRVNTRPLLEKLNAI